jgi:hypothetical protein
VGGLIAPWTMSGRAIPKGHQLCSRRDTDARARATSISPRPRPSGHPRSSIVLSHCPYGVRHQCAGSSTTWRVSATTPGKPISGACAKPYAGFTHNVNRPPSIGSPGIRASYTDEQYLREMRRRPRSRNVKVERVQRRGPFPMADHQRTRRTTWRNRAGSSPLDRAAQTARA